MSSLADKYWTPCQWLGARGGKRERSGTVPDGAGKGSCLPLMMMDAPLPGMDIPLLVALTEVPLPARDRGRAHSVPPRRRT